MSQIQLSTCLLPVVLLAFSQRLAAQQCDCGVDTTPPTVTCPPPASQLEWPEGFNTNQVGANTPQDPSLDPGTTGFPSDIWDNCLITLYEERFDEEGAGVRGPCESPDPITMTGPFNPLDICVYNPPSNGQWTVAGDMYSLSGGTNADSLAVINGRLRANDIDGTLCFRTTPIDISGVYAAGFSLELSEEGLGSNDQVEVRYSLDGGTFVTVAVFGGGALEIPFSTVSKTGLIGSELVIEVCFSNNRNPEFYWLDNVVVTGLVQAPSVSYQDAIELLSPCQSPDNLAARVTRTWTIADECGNPTECTQVFEYVDTTPPTAECPTSPAEPMELPTDFNTDPVGPDTPQFPSLHPDNTGSPLNELDNYTENPQVTYQDVIESLGPCQFPGDPIWRVTRSWTISDDCGNAAVCEQVFEFIDTAPPTADCPPSPENAIALPVNFNFNQANPNTPQDPSIDPSVTGSPASSAVDNSGATPEVSYQDILTGPFPGAPGQIQWIVTRTWVISDDCGNQNSDCVQVFEFTESEPATVTCPTAPAAPIEWPGPTNFNTTVVGPNTPQDPSLDPNDMGMPVVHADCAPAVAVNYQDVLEFVGACNAADPIIWRVVRVWTVEDNCGNTVRCIQIFAFQDTTPPTAVCPATSLEFEWPADFNTAAVGPNTPQDSRIAPSVTGFPTNRQDNSGQLPSIEYQDVIVSLGPCQGAGAPIWQVTRTWMITDDCGNAKECEQVFTFVDTTAPTVDCSTAPDEQIELPMNLLTTAVGPNTPQHASIAPSETGFPTIVQENSGAEPSLAYQDAIVFMGECQNPGDPIWRVTRTWTITDDCGNAGECVQVFDFVDTTAPTVDCSTVPGEQVELPMNFSTTTVGPNTPQHASIAPSETGFPTIVQENSGAEPSLAYQDAIVFLGECQNPGDPIWRVTRTWTITDDCGNAGECVQVFDFVDTTAPMAVCPVSPEERTTWPPDFNTTPVGPNTPQDDRIRPDLTGSPVIEGDNSTAEPTVSYQDVLEFLGPCQDAGDPVWRVTRTWTITDDCGNALECIQTFNYYDTTPPTADCPASPVGQMECSPNFNTTAVGPNTPQDPSIDPSVTGEPTNLLDDFTTEPSFEYQDVITSQSCEGPGDPVLVVTRTWTISDDCGNALECVQTFTFIDTTAPTADCPDSPEVALQYPADFAPGLVAPNTSQSSVIDPTVPLVLYEQYFDDGAEHDAGMTGDADGCMNNLADCLNRLDRNDGTWTITAGDDPPNFYLENTGDYLEVIDASQLEAADLDDRLCFETIPIDIRGMASVDFSLKMFDNSTRMPDGSSGLESDDGFDVSYSIDGGATFELPLVASVRGGFDPTTVVKEGITGDDLVIRVCFFSTGGGDKVALDDVIVTRSNAPVNVTDNCDASPSVTYQDVAETFGPCQSSDQLLARVTRTWTIADDCGNGTECTQVFNFVDSTPPTAICPVSPEIQECLPNFNMTEVGPNTPQDDRIAPSVTGFPTDVQDNYTASPAVEYQDAIQVLQCQAFGDPVMQVTRTWTITDDCGNALECIQVFRYTDTMAPTADCPLSPDGYLEYPVSLSQTPVGPNTPQDASIDPSITGEPANVQDNCATPPSVEYQDVFEFLGACQVPMARVTRTWTIMDDCINAIQCVQVFEFVDTAPLAVDCPPSPGPIEYPAGFDAGPVGPNMPQSPVIDPTVPLVLYEQYFDDGSEHDAGITGDADGCVNNLADCLNRLDRNNGTWIITTGDDPPNFNLENTGDYLEVIDASQLEAADLDDRLCFENLPIDIRGMASVDFSLKMFDNSTRAPDGSSGLESDDGFDVSYSVDGGATFVPPIVSVRGGFDPTTVVHEGISGDDLVIRVCFFSTGGGDKVALDDVVVTSSSVPTNIMDSGAPPTVSYQDVAEVLGACQAPGDPVARVTRTWTITDECDQATECVQVFDFVDRTPPTADCPDSPLEPMECPPNFNMTEVAANTPQDASIDPSITGVPANVQDNYTASPSVEYQDAIQFLPCQAFGDPVMQVTRTWTITDDCGNALECIQVFQYTDTTAPTADCPLSSEGYLEYPVGLSQTPVGPNTPQDASIDPSITGEPANVQDNCATPPSVEYQDVFEFLGACQVPMARVTRTWTISDDCNNAIECVQIFEFVDTAPPMVDCPPSPDPIEYPAGFDISPVGPNMPQSPLIDPTAVRVLYEQYFDESEQAEAGIQGDGDGTGPDDGCINVLGDCWNRLNEGDGTWTITPGDDPPNFNLANTGDYLQVVAGGRLEAADLDDRLCFETLPIDIRDLGAVAFSLKMFDTSTRTETGESGLESDDGYDVSYSVDGGTTFTALIASVRGGFDPMTIVEEGITGEDLVIRVCFFSTGGGDNVALDDVIVTGTLAPPNAIDNYDTSPTVSYQDVAESFGSCQSGQPIVRVTRTWSFTDDCNNTTECVQVFDFTDTTAPTADCPPAPAQMEWPEDFNTAPVGLNMPQDTSIRPTITGFPANVQDNLDQEVEVNYQDVLLSLGPCQGSGSPVWQVTRTWTIVDDCGNSLECVQVFEFVDTTPPAAECPVSSFEPVALPDGFNMTAVGPNTPQHSSIDPFLTGSPVNVGDNYTALPTVNYQDVLEVLGPGEIPSLSYWRVTRTWTIADGCGNVTECVQEFLFFAPTPPSVDCPQAVFDPVECPEGFNLEAVGPDTPQHSSIDPANTGTPENIRSYCFIPLYEERFEEEGAGLQGPCESPNPLTNEGPFDPQVICAHTPPSNGQWLIFGDVYDLSGGVDADAVMVLDGRLQANDIDGTLCFETSPVDISASLSVGFSLDLSQVGPFEEDQDSVEVRYSIDGGAFITVQSIKGDNVGALTTVAKSNLVGSSLVIQVCFSSNSNDEIHRLDNVVVWGEAPETTVSYQDVVEPLGPCETPGETVLQVTRTWTITNDCGITSQCEQIFQYFDTTAPTAVCPSSPASPADLPIDFNFDPVGPGTPQDPSLDPIDTGEPIDVQDNCDATPTKSYQDVLTGPFEQTGGQLMWVVTRTWTLTDDCGNVNMDCTQRFEFIEQTTTVVCPSSPGEAMEWPAEFNTTEVGPNTPQDQSLEPSLTGGEPLVSQECAPAVAMNYQDVIEFLGPCQAPGDVVWRVTRTWTVEDNCGNTEECTQVFEYIDTTAPTVDCPDSPQEAAELPAGFNFDPVAADTPQDPSLEPSITGEPTEDPSLEIHYQDAVSFIGPCQVPTDPIWRVTRTWTISDDCGNTQECQQVFDFYSNQPCAIVVSPVVYLQGPYDPVSGLMRDNLRSGGLLPLNEPYTGLGYTHVGGGGEMTSQGVFDVTGLNAIVDWVLLELRDKTDPAVIVATRAALLQSDGEVVDIDGVSPVSFDGLPADDYYLAIRHRNHLGVMSAAPINLSAVATVVDFTSDLNALLGGANGIAVMDDGKLGLYSGDYNRNGQVQNTDYVGMVTTLGTAGYVAGDLDLNGQVQNTDLQLKLIPNIGRGSAIP